ncbi:pyridoxamine 5'-phosphate oxidase family protein [candidate division KSB1 bacterium]
MSKRGTLRRSEKEITDRSAVEAVLQRAEVCRIAMVNGDEPYVIPMNFGYRDSTLYFHSFKKGMKTGLLEKNDRVCFEADVDIKIWPAERICDWGFRYRSVIGFGRAHLIEDRKEKLEALDVIIRHYTDIDYDIPEEELDKLAVYKVPVEHITGKQAGYGSPESGE